MADVPTPAPNASPSGGAAEKGGNILTKRIGPLPVIGWVIVAVGVYLVYRYIQNRNAASTAATDTSAPLATNNALPGTDQTTNPTDTTTTPGSATGDEDWVTKARADLIRLGYSPETVDMVLRRYMSGEQLDAQEQAIIDAAINLNGSPPGGGGNLGTLAPPKPKPKKPPVHKPTHGVGSGHHPVRRPIDGGPADKLQDGIGGPPGHSGDHGPIKAPIKAPPHPVRKPIRLPVNTHHNFGAGRFLR